MSIPARVAFQPVTAESKFLSLSLAACAISLCVLAAGAARAAPSCRPASLDAAATPIDLNDFKGRFLYLDFWASWCAPCKKSFPFMNDLHRAMADRPFALLAVSLDEDAAAAHRFLEHTPAEFPVAIDTTGECPKAFGLKGMPTSYLIGPDGKVLFAHLGFRASDDKRLKKAIDLAFEKTAD